jgi:hypothetical protein
MYHKCKSAGDSETQVVRLVTRRDFIDEGLLFLDDFEQTVLYLANSSGDGDVWQWLAESMVGFRDDAALHHLYDASFLASEIAQVFVSRKRGGKRKQLSSNTLYLVYAALSQLRFMLAPSLNGSGENSLRIMTGLMREL